MQAGKGLKTFLVSLLMLVSVSLPVVLACALPALNLPTGEIEAYHHKMGNDGDEGLFDVELYVGEGYDIEDGHYVGFCIDPLAGSVPSTRELYSSYDPNMPQDVRTFNGQAVPWDQINYLLNHRRGGGWLDVQAALELIITGESNSWQPTDLSLALVAEAKALGGGFVPGPGQILAVILYSTGITNDPADAQDTLILVPLPEEQEPCGECEGGVSKLTLRYLGDQAADILVLARQKGKLSVNLFEGTVPSGESFTVESSEPGKRMGNEIGLWVDGELDVRIHTSCSQPIAPGMVFGSFEIVSVYSVKGGLVCPMPGGGGDTCALAPAAGIEVKGREIKWELKNEGKNDLQIAAMVVSWPEANGDLTEVKLGKDKIHAGDFAPTSAAIDAGWEGKADKRTIEAGKKEPLSFKFESEASKPGAYHIVVQFSNGCAVAVERPGEPEPGPGPEPEPLPDVCSAMLSALSLTYTGPDLVGPVTIEFEPKAGGPVVYELDGLAKGTLLAAPSQLGWTIDALANGTRDLGAKLTIVLNGKPEVIHTSCSVEVRAGAPAPLDNPKGAPSALWFVEAFREK